MLANSLEGEAVVIDDSTKKLGELIPHDLAQHGRLKQSGMFWLKRGAEVAITLYACYFSGSYRWHDFWYNQPIQT